MVPHALFSAVVVKVPLLRTANVFLVGPLVRARSLCSLFLFLRFLYGYFLADVARCVVARIIPIRSVALRMGLHELCALGLRSFQCNRSSKPKGFFDRRKTPKAQPRSRDRRPGSAQKRYFARAIVIWWITAFLDRFLTVVKGHF